MILIDVRTIWRHLVSKVVMKKAGKEMTTYLGDFQFGIGISGALILFCMLLVVWLRSIGKNPIFHASGGF